MDIEYVDKYDKDGNRLNFVRYRGHIFVKGFPRDAETRLDQIQEMDIRDDDIILVEFPKSGLHLTNNIVNMLITGTIKYKGTPIIPEYDDFDEMKAAKSPRILGFHTHYELLPKQVRDGKGKIVYIIRNPKDVMTSLYFYNSNMTQGTYWGSFSGYLRFFLQEEFYFDTWFKFVKGWNKVIKELPQNKVFLVQYESLLKNKLQMVQQLSEFLEQPHSGDFLQSVVDATDINLMRAQHSNQGSELRSDMKIFNDGPLPIYRKGVIGDWKNHFTVAQNEEFDRVCAERMQGCDLVFDYGDNVGM